jgi:hypothetical protein
MMGLEKFKKDIKLEQNRYKDASKYIIVTGWRDKKNEAIAKFNAEPKDKRPKRDILGVFLRQKKLIEEIAENLKIVVLRFTKTGNKENFETNLNKVGRIASDNVKIMLGTSSGSKLFPENSSAVVKRKGRNTPMVNTENLKDSISSWIKKIV